MTSSSGSEYERAETEAATWLVLLAEDPDDRDLARRFEAWRTASPLHAELWARTTRGYELAGKVGPAEAAKPSTVVPFARPKRRALRIGAIAAIAACLLLLAAPSVLLRLEADHLTATAELRALTLEDGTQVRLGPESALGVDFSPGERRVRLLKGQAFFEVTPNPSRPFKVTAGDVVTTVLGTAFEVGLSGADVDVAVRHGLVRVDSGAARVSEKLGAGDWVTVRRGSGVSQGKRNVEEIGDWMAGELIVRDRPMTEIVDALRRYFDGMIVVQDSAFARTQVTGVYDLRHPEATLTSLAASHDARVRRVSPWLLIVTSK